MKTHMPMLSRRKLWIVFGLLYIVGNKFSISLAPFKNKNAAEFPPAASIAVKTAMCGTQMLYEYRNWSE